MPFAPKNKPAGSNVVVNKPAVTQLALYGPQDRVEQLHREVKRTLTRLGVSAEKAKPLARPARVVGSTPSLHDVLRWLDDLTVNRRRDVRFLCRLYKTTALRAE